jgi:hypothetical protein
VTTDDPRDDECRFVETVDTIRNSPEQLALQKRAASLVFRAMCMSALAGAAATLAVLALVMYAMTSPIAAIAGAVVAAVVAAKTFFRAEGRIVEAAHVWKEQDQRNLLGAIRAAGSAWQLNLAGFFAYLPGTNTREPGFNESASLEILRKEKDRMLAALSNDPLEWLE